MKFNIKFFLGIIAFAIFGVTNANEKTGWSENKVIARLFSNANVEGTFVLYDVTENKLTGFNRARAETRFIPASTFKIPNSLIGLSVGAIKSVDEVFPYDGKPYGRKVCEKDVDLREAYKSSCLPVYQVIARRIGLNRMQAEVTKLNYGNTDIGTKVDEFWIEGPLKISAVEQTQFLSKLAQKTLPFPMDAQEKVHDIARFDQGDGWILYAKTGWTGQGTKEKPGTGWWVGWVKKGERFYTFALNIDTTKGMKLEKRIELGRASLKELGVID